MTFQVSNLRIHSLNKKTKQKTPASSCLSSRLLPSSFIIVYFLVPDEDNFLSKALVFHCFFVFRRIGEYISSALSVFNENYTSH